MIETAHETYEQIRTKECTKCKEIKLLTDFSKDKNRRNGLYPYCKECVKQYFEKNKEK